MTGEPPRNRRTTLLAVLAIVAFVAAIRFRLADVPLERDEGEYGYAGQLLLQGVPPWAHAYNMKFPGASYAYAAIMALGGQSARAIHLGLLVVNSATILLVFALGRRLLGNPAGAVAAGFFALLSLDRGVLGVWAHATHFALLFALAGLVLAERGQGQTRAGARLFAGVLLGTAVLMKQHAVLFLGIGLALAGHEPLGPARRDPRAALRAAAWLALGFALPLAALAALLAAQGVFARFWFWTVSYGTHYVASVPVEDALHRLRYGLGQVASKTFAMWLLAAGGAVLLFVLDWPARVRAFLLGLAVVSLVAVCPGFYFREHYFILLLPALALLAALATESVRRLLLRAGRTPGTARLGALALALVCAGHYLISERAYLFTMSTDQLCRSRYKANIFADAVAIAGHIREHTQPSDRIAVLGSEPEMFFYANRRSATGYIYVYALMEAQPYAHRMQEEMIRDIEAARPAYLVTVKAFPSWLSRSDSDRTIFAWARGYTREHYEEVGRVDGDGTGQTRIHWAGPPQNPGPSMETLARVYRRKADAAQQ